MQDSDAPVEQATAAPGEKRHVARRGDTLVVTTPTLLSPGVADEYKNRLEEETGCKVMLIVGAEVGAVISADETR